MLTLLSPAKKLETSKLNLSLELTLPEFNIDTKKILAVLKNKSVADLQKLYSVSKEIAELNFQRFKDFDHDYKEENTKASLFMFAGEVYNGLDANNFSNQELDFANSNLRILSGLYGILRPLDKINPYRLEMGTKCAIGSCKNLYEFWQNNITEYINNTENKVIINLASTEYFKVVKEKKLKARIVTPVFKDFKNGEYKIIMMYAKKARGLMANYIVKNKITEWQNLKLFNYEGYRFHPEMSDIDNINKKLVFIRE